MSTPLPSIVSEVRRYTVLPGQATSYKIGMLKIQELRANAEEALGERFDIRAFHDVILGGGAHHWKYWNDELIITSLCRYNPSLKHVAKSTTQIN